MTGGEPSGDAYGRDDGRLGDGERRASGRCARCGGRFPRQPANSVGTGYARMDLGGGPVKVCYDCCALYDKEWMRKHGRITLYLAGDASDLKVTNWPGTLAFHCHSWSAGKHNWGLAHTDVWFTFEGEVWWGVHIGHNSDLVHCRRTKQKA